MITNEAVNRAIDYILRNTEEELSLDDVAKHCHFSKYYFSRLFKAQTGESVYAFMKRARLEKSAFRLKTERKRCITEIGIDCGYSASNYSTTFRQRYHMTPVSFRKNSYREGMEHPFFHRENWKVESFEECDSKITLRDIPDYWIIYERRFGSYEDLSRDWKEFLEKYGVYVTEDTKFVERTWDDPAVTAPEGCLYDIGMTVGEDCPFENKTFLPGARCIVYRFKGHMKYIYAAYQTIFLVWLPKTGYVIDNSKSVFDIYRSVDCDTMHMELDICLPIKE